MAAKVILNRLCNPGREMVFLGSRYVVVLRYGGDQIIDPPPRFLKQFLQWVVKGRARRKNGHAECCLEMRSRHELQKAAKNEGRSNEMLELLKEARVFGHCL
jgi:hypothetical protein